MPHCILEYSSNILDKVDLPAFFRGLHELMVRTGEIQLDQIKSRWVCHDNYLIGDGTEKNAFVYLQIAMLSGRSETVRASVAQAALELLNSLYPRSRSELSCSITVEVREINRSTHGKVTK